MIIAMIKMIIVIVIVLIEVNKEGHWLREDEIEDNLTEANFNHDNVSVWLWLRWLVVNLFSLLYLNFDYQISGIEIKQKILIY